MTIDQLILIAGFLVASYAIVANDAIQTLGTFLSSNAERPWWVLWLFASGILTVVLIYGWVWGNGDVSYGRLAEFPYPEHNTWVFLIPPLVILALTRVGAPVSTTFLILTAFATRALGDMVLKSLLGYAVAFVLGIAIYKLISKQFEKRFIESDEPSHQGWVVLQWCSTGFLWSQWLIQDLANIFAYMPRRLSAWHLAFALIVMLILHAILFAQRGGAIQKIVTSKTNTQDIRSATIIDFLYALVLLVFKEYSHVPMSTTWVFLGLLAGRELAITYDLKVRELHETGLMIAKDAGKAALGLGVSVIIALVLQVVAPPIRQLADAESAVHEPPSASERGPDVGTAPGVSAAQVVGVGH